MVSEGSGPGRGPRRPRQGGFAERRLVAVGEDAAAQVGEVAAQGQVAVHGDVGAVHGQRGPALGHVRRRASAQQPSRPEPTVRLTPA